MTDQPAPPSSVRIMDVDVRRLAIATVSASLIVWWPAFTLGVYGAIFFEQILALWASATATFLIMLFVLGRRVWALPGMYSLLTPSVWILLTWLVPAEGTGLGHDIVFWLGAAVTLAGFPAMAALLAVLVVPGVGSVRRGRHRVGALAVVAVVAVLSYVIGTQHPYLLTCEDFTISGNDQPVGCTPGSGVTTR